MPDNIHIRMTSYGFLARWQDQDGQWWEQTINCQAEDLHPFMWESNAAEGLGL